MLALLPRAGFTGGVKPAYAPHAIPKNALADARNIDADEIGTLSVRPGGVSVAPSLGAGGVHGLCAAFGTLVCAWQGSLYRLEDGEWVIIRRSFLPTTWTNMVSWQYDTEQVLYVHGGNGIWRATAQGCLPVTPYVPDEGEDVNLLLAEGGGQDPDSDIYKATIGLLRPGLHSRMCVAHGNTVYFSAPDRPDYWPSEQCFKLPDDGGRIVGLALRYGALLILRDKDIWAYFLGISETVDETARLVLQDSSTGCVATRSIASVPDLGILFLGPDNVYALRGVEGVEDQVRAVPMGDDVKPYLDRAMESGTSGGADACGVYYDRQYHLSFPSAARPERVFRLKTYPLGWYCDTGPRTIGYAVAGGKLYSALPSVGKVLERTGLTDDGDPIIWEISFPHEALSPGRAKVKRLYLHLKGTDTMQHVNATVVGDGRATSAVEFGVGAEASEKMAIGTGGIGTAMIGNVNELRVYEGRVSVKGHNAQVHLDGDRAEQLGIVGYTLGYRPKARAKGIKEGVVRKWPS